MKRPDVDQMLAEMTSRQYQEWKEFYSVDPWGDQRADLRNAQLACIMANAWRGRKQAPIQLATFLLFPDEDNKPPVGDMRQLMSRLRAQARRAGRIITNGHIG